ncbi:MAG: DEAD/DEAH box helicase [Myxococcaceae bacterium]|nr:DEAD/DEAH box helicase [Myxococcaceae bacterium]MBH2006323.1 DEAD/DEAH box helicase [Myxococcaceae bacterium]
MTEYSWLRLREHFKQEQSPLTVVFHELPRREGKCLAELKIDSHESVTEPAKLLEPKSGLSVRQQACVQVFLSATAFSAKRDIWALSPSQAVSILLLANDVQIEIRNRGFITFTMEPARIRANGVESGLIFEAAVDGKKLEVLAVLGQERSFLLDSSLRLFTVEPWLMPTEIDALLNAEPIGVDAFASELNQETYTQLAKLGVDFSCFRMNALVPHSEIVLRALLGRQMELRLHLVTTLECQGEADEVEIRSKGDLEPVFWLKGLWVQRPTQQEQAAREWLYSMGASPSSKNRGFSAKGQRALDILESLSRQDQLPQGIQLDRDCLPVLVPLPEIPTLRIERTQTSQVEVRVSAGELSFSLEKLFEVLDQEGRAMLLDEDHVLTFSPQAGHLFRRLSEVLDVTKLGEEKEYSFYEIASLLKMFEGQVSIQADLQLMERLRLFVPELIPSDHVLPANLKATLRPYQNDAIAWMSQLHRAGLGRLLADEMGLGKTLMVLTLIAKVREQEGQKPTLVIAPTSVLDVWISESQTHFSGMMALKWHGLDREERIEDAEKADIIVTSYALLRRDLSLFEKISFRYLIIDEAQIVKNSKTESWRAAKSIRAEQRLALSGTPIENRISDLFSILELVAPGILGDEKRFLKRYGAGDRNPELRDRVRPMILRRRKEEVASDLPPKIESILHCEMKDFQRTLYIEILRAAQHELSSMAQTSIPLLAALTRLRQACCDPSLIPGQGIESSSAKVDLFLETVKECLANGRRVIVYSQFVKMQQILIAKLREIGVNDTLWLHGATQNRGDIVEAFQKPDGPGVIVVSLKAGGTGITLTAADTIIYYDPWWNPAVMDQAADRAHRIGQTKTVHLIKLVCKNSIEEQILALCERKRAIANDVLLGEGSGPKSLTLEDIKQLLEVEFEREF